MLHLTYDDGPDPADTPRLLDVLEAGEAAATFFVLARAAARCPELIARMVEDGHEVGLHAEAHVRHSELSRAEIEADARAGLARLDALGVRPRRWRTPWGTVTADSRAVAAELELELYGWTLDSEDWAGHTADAMLARLAPAVGGQQTILMHDGLGPGVLRGGCAATLELTGHLLALARELDLEVGVPGAVHA